MLRATTDTMVNVLCGVVALAAVVSFLKGKFGGAAKVALLVAAAVAIVLLKTFDAKFWGVVVMGGAVIILFFLPWLDHSPVQVDPLPPGLAQVAVRRVRGRLLVLGYLGIQPPSRSATLSRRSARSSTSASSC
jgi:ubiquinol-cytochrome c reductase cytochrome b subunit